MEKSKEIANLLGDVSYEDWINIKYQVDWLFKNKIIESKISLDDSEFLSECLKEM